MTVPHLILSISLAGLAVLATEPLWSHARRPQAAGALFAGLICAALVSGHWPALVANRPLGNPDEAQMLAGALTLRHDPVFWRSVDGTTHGPFAQWPLVFAAALGAPLDFTTARVVAVACTAGLLMLLGAALNTSYGALTARLALLPTTAWLAATPEPEFLLYSSEHVALLLLAGACLAVAPGAGGHTRLRAFIVGSLVVAVPFAKLQAGPLAAGVALFWLATMGISPATRSRRGGLALAALGGGLGSLALAVGPACLAGEAREVWRSYVLGNLAYAAESDWQFDSPRLVWGLNWLLLLTAAAVLFTLLWRGRVLLRQPMSLLAALCSGLGVGAILLPGRPFIHYWLLIIPATVLLAGAACAAGREILERPGRLPVVTGLAGILLLPFAGKALTQDFPRWDGLSTAPYPAQAAAAIRALALPTESVAVWGWAPELYVLAQRRQATREAHTYAQIQSGPRREEMRRRFLTDLQRSRPAVFADAVHPGAFAYTDVARQGHESDATLAAWIDLHYRFAGKYDGVRLYARRPAAP